jgi:RNA polymerase sigma-70 factor (ECF subfamily)
MPTPHTHRPVSLVVAPDPREMDDAELGRALVAGRPWAVAETWRRFAPPVIMLARRALGSESEAEDVAQETFHRLFTRAHTLRAPDQLRSFIFSFAIRVLKTELRRRKRWGWLSFHPPETILDLGAEVVDVESRDLLRRFYRLLDRLAPRHRLVFTLRHLEAMTVEEVAVHSQLSESTVKRALARATDKMVRWIEGDPGLVDLVDSKRWRR